MALQVNDTTAIINTTTNLVSAATDYCCCFWYQQSFYATAPAYTAPFATIDAGYTTWALVISDQGFSTGLSGVWVANSITGANTPEIVLPLNTPVHLAYRRFGTTHQFLVNGYIVGTTVLDISANVWAEMLLGNDRFSVVSAPLIFWDFKEWTNSKSVGTVREEMAAYGTVVSSSGLQRFCPLVSDLLDDSGNGFDFTGAGNFSFVANPTLPLNLTPAAATVISSLPYEVNLPETYNLPFWLRYTPQPGDRYLGAWNFGGLGAYEPTTYIWTGDGTIEWPDASWQTIGVNVPLQTPLVVGQTIYLEARTNFGAAFASLDVSILPEPNTPAPIGGAFFVTDDSPGYGAALISASDGHVYQFKYPGYPASDIGTNLVEGSKRILLVSDLVGDDPSLFLNEIYIYDADLSLVTTLARGSDGIDGCTSNKVDTFYLDFNPSGAVDHYVKRLSEDGVLDSTIIGPITGTTVTTAMAMAVSPDESILYYQRSGNNLGAIRQWDLVNNVALADLIASPGAGWFMLGAGCLITLPDGSLIGGFDQFLSGAGGFLRRYAPDGTVLWSFDVGALGIDYHGAKLSYGANWPDDIWFVAHFTGGHSQFFNLATADGSTIDAFTAPTFSIGTYDPVESATPEARFGPAPSCMFVMLQEGIPICPGLRGAPRIGI